MRRSLLLVPALLLVLTGCIPQPPIAPVESDPTTPMIQPVDPTTTTPATDEPAADDGLAAVGAAVEGADGVVAVEAGDDGYGPTMVIDVDDDIDRATLQALVEQVRDEADALGVDLGDCLCTVESASATLGVLAWFGTDLPSDMTALFDAWEWMDGIADDGRPEVWISECSSVTGYAEHGSEGATTFIDGVAEDGEVADVIGSDVYELAYVTYDGYDRCLRLSVGEELDPEVAELLATIVTEGLGDHDEVCVSMSFDTYGVYLSDASLLGEDSDAQLIADVVAAFDEIDVEVVI